MKTIYKICVVVITTLLMNVSCSLDEYNPGGVTPETVFTTPEGYETLINQCYSNLRSMCYGREDMMFFNETGTDLWNMVNDKNYLQQINKYQDLSSSINAVKNVWERFYVPINLCNAAIDRIDFAGYIDANTKNAKVAEAHFLRAFLYWHIVEQYGNVSLSAKETTSPVLVAYRSPVSDFYKLIFDDLKFAKDNLPLDQPKGENGRATKKAAHALLARMYLTYASHLFYFENNKTEADKYYLLAKTTADEVITASKSTYKTKLYDNFEDVFDPANNKTNQEALYVVSHSYNPALEVNSSNPNRLFGWYQAQYSNQPGMMQTLTEGRDNSRHLQPSKYLLELFDETMDARYNASFQEVWLCNDATKNTWNANWMEVYKKDQSVITIGSPIAIKGVGDTALLFTKKYISDKAKRQYAVFDMSDIYNADGTYAHVSGQKNFFPTLRKFRDPYRSAASSQAGGMDVIIIRLSEMYLIAAEAEFHLGNEGLALEYINVLRTRAAIKTPVDKTEQMKITTANIGQTINGIPAYLNLILDERARELCGEHLRWFDLKRTKQLENRLGVGAPIPGNPNIVLFDKAKHYIRPIPLTFLQALENETEFGQNPGY